MTPDDDQYDIKAEALRIWNEYQMHTQGGITYPMMGYVSADGTIPAFKLHEHQLVHAFYMQAKHEKDEQDRRKREAAARRAQRGR